ncbi:MAG: bifunctional DNA-binding transcriptional regulator/O6-methylguanine-DNA methyltransferase Ada [Myxococcota bacterium]
MTPTKNPRYEAVLRRDRSQDGQFFYAVKTTGIFCRPSCAARTPRQENVEFFEDAAKARAAGYRPCKRCQPESSFRQEQNVLMVTKICRIIEEAEHEPTLSEIAEAVGLSPHHLHRVFKAATGLTPKAYARALRATAARRGLEGTRTVTQAIFDAGFNSSSRFYEHAKQRLGMTPHQFRTGGQGEIIRFAVGECTLGSFLVAATERGVCAILLGDDPEALVQDLQHRFARATLVGADEAFEGTVAQVVGLLEDPTLESHLPLDIRGTAFQERVWQALREIPAGERRTYADIAEAIGSPRATRAVARACGANPLAVAVPCHRVVAKDGSLSGYRWGIERKHRLLQREGGPKRS